MCCVCLFLISWGFSAEGLDLREIRLFSLYNVLILLFFTAVLIACGSAGEDLLGIDKTDLRGPISDASNPTGTVAPPGNTTPIINVDSPSTGGTGNILITYTIVDGESNACFITPEFSPDGGANWYYATEGAGSDGIENLDSSPDGIAHTYSWDSYADGVAIFAINGNVMFRIKVSDYYVEGDYSTTTAFLVNNSGNTNPSVSVVTPAGTQQGNITITYSIVDVQQDPISITVEYSLDGGSNWAAAVSAGGDGLTDLTSSGVGVQHTYIWDSVSNGAGMQYPADNDIRIRITPDDGNGAGLFGETSDFTVGNLSPGTFALTAKMTTGRYWHTSTTLVDGRVLIAGGYDGTTALATVEIYDATTGEFTQVTDMNTARYGHSAVLLATGNVLVTGGINAAGTYLNGAEEYDPIAGTWDNTVNSMVVPAAAVNRAFHQSALQSDDRVVVWSGRNTATTTTLTYHIYDPVARTFSNSIAIPTANTSRDGFSIIGVDGGKFIILGGSFANDGTGVMVDTCQVYSSDAGNGVVADSGNLLAGRYWPGAVRLEDNTVFICGGSADVNVWTSCDIYDPGTGLVSNAGDMSEARRRHIAALLDDGKVLIAGGESLNPTRISQTAEIFDPDTNGFAYTSGSMNYKRYFHTYNTLPDGKIMIIGGYDNAQVPRECEVYIP